jgi:RNA polymerase sigma-70 factor (ECF subfamily)
MDKRECDALAQKVALGDGAAFEKLYDGMKRGVFAFAYTYMQNFADAEDIVQETFLAVKRKAYTYQAGTDARAWVFQIAKNKCLDELRRRKSRGETETVQERGEELRFPMLDEMTACLDESEREIVLLHAVWAYKHKEIAQMQKLPLGTVTWKYKRAIEKLKKYHKESAGE